MAWIPGPRPPRLNGYRFTVSRKASDNLETIRFTGNNILEFLSSSGYIRFKADGEVSSKALYEAYRQWCTDNTCHALAASRLSSELAQNEGKYNVEATNNIHLPDGRRVRGFLGIELIPRKEIP